MRRIGLAAVVLAFATWQAQGAVPAELHFQGRLTDPVGTPITAAVDVTFSLYDVSTGGIPIWTETHAGVTPTDGVFSATLGANVANPLTLADFRDNPRLYLGVQVEADLEMTPRYAVCTSAYAFVAMHAETSATLGSVTETHVTDNAADIATNAGAIAANGTAIIMNATAIAANATAIATKATAAELDDGDDTSTPVGWDDVAGKPATYTPSAHNHSAVDVTSGVLDNARYSAYSDLSAEGYLNNDATTDLLTRGQSDGRFLLKTTPASDVGGVNLAAGLYYVTPVNHAPLRDGQALVTVDVSFFNIAGGANTTDGPEFRVCMVPSESAWVNDGLQGMLPGPLDALGRAGLSRTAVFPVSSAETYRFGAYTGGTPADWIGDAMYMHVTVVFLY